MSEKKQLNKEELEKVSGGTGNSIVYVASVFRDDGYEDEVEGYYETQSAAFDAACEQVQLLLRMVAEITFVVKVYTYNFSTQIKEEVYSETMVFDEYYKQIR